MSGSVVLDVVLVIALLGYGVTGWRQGVVASVLGLVGLVGGAFLALRFAPDLLEDRAGVDIGTTTGAIVLVGVVFVTAALAQSLMLVLGRRVRDSVRAPLARAVDSLLGLVAVVAAAVLVVWVVAGALRHDGPPPLRSLVAGSAVVQAIDEVVPPSAGRLVDGVTRALDAGGFPRVFEGLGPEPIPPVAAPDEGFVDDPDVVRALGSVIHVRADAGRCDRAQVGSGWVVAPGRVVTNAHVVAAADDVRVSVKGTGRDLAARVVAFDPRRDVAVLDVPGLPAPALALGRELAAGDPAVLAGFPGDAGLTVGGARVRTTLTRAGRRHLRPARCRPRDLLAARDDPQRRLRGTGARPRGRGRRHGLRDLPRRPRHRVRPHPRRDRAGRPAWRLRRVGRLDGAVRPGLTSC